MGESVDPYEGYTLIFHLDGNDELQNGYWIDKVMGTRWQAINNPTRSDDGGWNVNINRYFRLNSPNTSGFYLPRHYKMEFTFKCSSNNYLIDFASVCGANKALGILSRDRNGRYQDNYKLLGNSSGDVYGVYTNSNTPIINIGEKYTYIYGCIPYDASTDIQFVQPYGEKMVKAVNPHVPVSVPAGDWKSDFIGSGFTIGRCCNHSSNYSGSGVIYDFKIYGKSEQ